MILTINDIAAKANVSITTVSRFMNHPEMLKPETREKIKAIIEENSYSPNALARGLVKKTTKTIGVIMPDINNLFYPSLLRGIEDASEKEKHSIFLCNTDKDLYKEKTYFEHLLEKRVDGIILLGTRSVDQKENEHIRRYSKIIPVVMVNDFILDSDSYAVLTDEVEGAYKAVKYLLGLGHRKILHVTGEGRYTTYRKKRDGYLMAMYEVDGSVQSIIWNPEKKYDDKKFVENLFKKGEMPTAIFAASDQLAMATASALMRLGYRIPEDISIIGYADVPISAIFHPALTTVNQFPYLTGKKALNVMMQLISGKKPEQKKTVIQPELTFRDSCAPVNNNLYKPNAHKCNTIIDKHIIN